MMPPLDASPPLAAGSPPAAKGAPEPAVYANHFEVGFNAFEFLLNFGQNYDGAEGLAIANTRIVTAPAYAKVLRDLLDRSITDYEKVFGPIDTIEKP